MQCHLHHAVALVGEEVEGLVDPVSENWCVTSGENTPLRHHLHQAPHALLAARAQRGDDALVAQARVDGFVRGTSLPE